MKLADSFDVSGVGAFLPADNIVFDKEETANIPSFHTIHSYFVTGSF